MIDLHLHLDGSLTPYEILELSRLSAVELPSNDESILHSLLTYNGRGTLDDYLRKFELPLSVMQSAESVEYALCALIGRLAEKGYAYVEIRFAPILHTMKGATAEHIVQGALKGLRKASIPVGLILCCMRGQGREENIRTVELAARYKDDGVVGVDLAGAEARYPTEEYRDVFTLASRLGLNITIHAGEAAGEESVRAAMDFGAKRIGHGIAVKSTDLISRIKANDVLIEVCPTSNLQTGAVDSIDRHPIARFLESGISVALCSDNMTVSDTDVLREWQKVKCAFDYSDEVFARMMSDARSHAFLGGF